MIDRRRSQPPHFTRRPPDGAPLLLAAEPVYLLPQPAHPRVFAAHRCAPAPRPIRQLNEVLESTLPVTRAPAFARRLSAQCARALEVVAERGVFLLIRCIMLAILFHLVVWSFVFWGPSYADLLAATEWVIQTVLWYGISPLW